MPSGLWHREEYDKLPRYDEPTYAQPTGIFLCHQADGRVCAGWAGTHDTYELLALRLAINVWGMTPEDLQATLDYVSPVPLFASGREAADHGMADVEDPGPRALRVIDRLAPKIRSREEGPMTRARVTPATIPAPLLAAALRKYAAYADDGYGLRAATELLIRFNAGRLLDEPWLRAHVTLADDGESAIVDWTALHADCEPHATAETGRHVALLACALAAGTPMPRLGRLLTRLDGWHARHALYALYTTMGGDERDPDRAWLAYCASAALGERVDVELMASMFTDRIVAERRRRDGVVGEITPAIATEHLTRMLCRPWWTQHRHGPGSPRAVTWAWAAGEATQVEVALLRSGTLLVVLRSEQGTWELTPNSGNPPDAPPTRPVSLFDLAALRDHLRYVHIPTGEL